MRIHPSDAANRSPRHWDSAVLLALTAAVIVFWWPCLFGRMAPLLGDAQSQMLPWRSARPAGAEPRWDALLWDGMAQYYPWRSFAARSARRGLIPLWNPHQFCGTPFVANGQSALFYPPNWLFFVVETRYAFALTAALHYLLGGLFVVLLGRELGLSPPAQLIGALAFAFGGFMVCWTELPTLMNTAAWLPGVVWAVERAFRRCSPLNACLIALTLAMALLAGHLQIAAYVWLVAGVHVLARTVWALVERRGGRAALVVLMFPLATALASIQLLPTYELASLSVRGSVNPDEGGFQFRKYRALQRAMLPTLFDPDALGSPEDWSRIGRAYSETCGYVGKLTLLLVALGLVAVREKRTLFFAGMAVIALSTAMGGPTARLLYYYCPGMAQAGGFGRVLCVYTFGMAMLAALGADRAVKWLGRERSGFSLLPRAAVSVGALCAVVVFVDLGLWGRRFLPLSPREAVYPAVAVAARLHEDTGRWRVLAVTKRNSWTIRRLPGAVLPPNSATAYGYDSVQGYDSLVPRVFGRYAGEVSPGGYTPRDNGNMTLIDSFSAAGLGPAAVKWVLTAYDEPPPGEGFAEVWRGEGLVVYENLAALPRVRPAAGGDVTDAAGHINISPATDPARVTCHLAEWPGGGLVVADALFPGWRVFVDGSQEELQLHPPMFREFRARPGAGRVEMVYAPASFTIGMFASLVAAGTLVGWVVCGRGDRRKRECVGRDEPEPAAED